MGLQAPGIATVSCFYFPILVFPEIRVAIKVNLNDVNIPEDNVHRRMELDMRREPFFFFPA